MKIKLYSDKELKQLKENNFLVIYRKRQFTSIETRYYKSKRAKIFYNDNKEDNFIGYYYVTFIEYGIQKEGVNVQFIKYLDWSGYDEVTEWILSVIRTDSKRRYPEWGAFYKISLSDLNTKPNHTKYERDDDY